MSFNGSGTFLINTAGQPVVAGTVISSTAFNALTADLATGLSTVITKDGQTTVTANIPMSTYKFTGLGVGSAATDSANLSQVQSTVTKLLTSVSGTDTITAVGAPVVAAYAAGQMFYFVATGDNTGAVTLNIDSLGAKAVTRDGSVALAAGDIKSGEVVVVVYDGTRFQVVSQLNSAGNATFANVSITSALNVGGVATFSAGTAAAPSITTTGDTNTGIFFPAADTIAFTEGGVEAARFDSSGNLGIGTTSPGQKLEVAGNIFVNTSGNPYAEIKTSGAGNNPSLKLTADTNSWTFQGTFSNANDDLLVLYNATTLLDLTKDGNLGLGVTPSAWQSGVKAFQNGAGALYTINTVQQRLSLNAYRDSAGTMRYINSSINAAEFRMGEGDGSFQFHTAASGTAGNAISFTQAMTLDASGRLLVGKTTNNAGEALQIDANGVGATIYSALIGNSSTSTSVYNVLRFTQGASGSATGYIGTGGSAVGNNAFANNFVVGTQTSNALVFATNDTERARITSGGVLLSGKTTDDDTVKGIAINGPAGELKATNTDNTVVIINRQTNDGVLVSFRQANAEEGTISVSGATVSYNAFAGSHWSQLQDGSKPDILRGTVMESINELCVWPDETNERLPKSKVSDTAGSKKVYGVFMAWDNDWATTNDMYVTAVGAFICRVNASVTVQEGDLLESNGDGTARVQADDIIRSSTIGKVTSTVKTHQYADGSYCVPTVLYCG
jgi:hypothetical protein